MMTEDDQVVAGAEDEATRRAEAQRRYLATLSAHLDLTVLASEAMWHLPGRSTSIVTSRGSLNWLPSTQV